MNTRTFIKSIILIGAAPQIIVPRLSDCFHWKATCSMDYVFFLGRSLYCVNARSDRDFFQKISSTVRRLYNCEPRYTPYSDFLLKTLNDIPKMDVIKFSDELFLSPPHVNSFGEDYIPMSSYGRSEPGHVLITKCG